MRHPVAAAMLLLLVLAACTGGGGGGVSGPYLGGAAGSSLREDARLR
jgi:hypothetical protein